MKEHTGSYINIGCSTRLRLDDLGEAGGEGGVGVLDDELVPGEGVGT
jgi:hypothetical protein